MSFIVDFVKDFNTLDEDEIKICETFNRQKQQKTTSSTRYVQTPTKQTVNSLYRPVLCLTLKNCVLANIIISSCTKNPTGEILAELTKTSFVDLLCIITQLAQVQFHRFMVHCTGSHKFIFYPSKIARSRRGGVYTSILSSFFTTMVVVSQKALFFPLIYIPTHIYIYQLTALRPNATGLI